MSDAPNLPARRRYDPSAIVSTNEPITADDVVEAFLRQYSANTLAAYDSDLKDFGRFYGGGLTAKQAVASLFQCSQATANMLVMRYRQWLEGQGLSPSTVGRRLAAIRSIVRLGRTLGQVTFTIDVRSPKQVKLRDTRGPGRDGWLMMRDAARQSAELGDHRAIRDLAIVAVLRGCALRRNELIELDLAHAELDGEPAIWIRGKGQSERIRLTLPDSSAEALRAWIAARGEEPGPLFYRMDRGVKYSGIMTRLTGRSIGRLVPKLAERSGIARRVRPHGIRHEAITAALDRTHGDVRRVQQFSRHKDVRTLMRYDDNRKDEAGSIAKLIDEG